MVLITALLLAASVVTGPVSVVDGDSIYVDGVHIRLHGLDAPEMSTPAGHVAKSAMIELVRGRTVRCELNGRKSYDRHIATCFLEGRNLAEEMIRNGVARPYCRFVGEAYNEAALEGGVRTCTRNHPTRPPR